VPYMQISRFQQTSVQSEGWTAATSTKAGYIAATDYTNPRQPPLRSGLGPYMVQNSSGIPARLADTSSCFRVFLNSSSLSHRSVEIYSSWPCVRMLVDRANSRANSLSSRRCIHPSIRSQQVRKDHHSLDIDGMRDRS